MKFTDIIIKRKRGLNTHKKVLNNMKKILIIFICVFIVLAITSGVVISALNNEKINVLIYGLDGRENSEIERSDSIILMNYHFVDSKITLTSIPRDSYVKITCKNNNYDKINHAYAYGGEKCLNSTVKQLFDLKTLKNIVFTFDSVISLIDYFGLIEITPVYSFCQYDEYGENKYCFEKDKKILIDGRQALAYMRARKDLPSGDFDRIKNQRQIFRILINEFLKLSLVEKIKFYNYAKKIVSTDLEIKDINLKKLINIQQINLNEYTLKGEDYFSTYYYYKLDYEYLEKIKKFYI